MTKDEFEKKIMSMHNVLFDYAVSMEIIDTLYEINSSHTREYAPEIISTVHNNRSNTLRRFETYLYHQCLKAMFITANEYWGEGSILKIKRSLHLLTIPKIDEDEIIKKISDLEFMISLYDDEHWANLKVARNYAGHHLLMTEIKQNRDLKKFFENDPHPHAVKFDLRMQSLLFHSFELVKLVQSNMCGKKFEHTLEESKDEAFGFVGLYDVEMRKLLDEERRNTNSALWGTVYPPLTNNDSMNKEELK